MTFRGRAGCRIDSIARSNRASGASRGCVSSREPANSSGTRLSPIHPRADHGPPSPGARGELDSELRRGSPDRQASTGSAWSLTLIIPTKPFWTNCRYDGQGARQKSGACRLVRRRAGRAPSTHRRLPTQISAPLLPPGGDERRGSRRCQRWLCAALFDPANAARHFGRPKDSAGPESRIFATRKYTRWPGCPTGP